MLEQSPVSLSTILKKSHWDSTSITAVWCESQVMFGKAVLPIKKSSTPPQSPPNSDFRFYILFLHYFKRLVKQIQYITTVRGNKTKNYINYQRWKECSDQRSLGFRVGHCPCATYLHRHLSNSHVTPPSLCKSSIHRQSIKEIAISKFPQAPVSKQG